MAEIYYSIKLSTLTEIGDAIRAKSGATGDIAVTSLATSILDLSPADDVIEWDGSGVVIAPIESEQPMTFTINGTSYQMDNQMTWYAWTRSDYNTDGFSCAEENDYVYEAESTNKVTDADGNDVLGTTYIVEGGAYLIKEEATTTDELAGTWVFNSYPDINANTTYNVQFSTPALDLDCTALILATPLGGNMSYRITTGNSYIAYEDGHWPSDDFKTIYISSSLSSVTNGDTLLTWLKANATKQDDVNEGATND